MAARRGVPPLGPYPYFEVISALRKEIKLGRVEDAIYWTNVILTHASGTPTTKQKTVAKQLWIMAAEDLDDPGIVLRAFAVYQMSGQVSETDHIFYLVAAMCRAPKWWETETGREANRLWQKAIGDLKKNPKEIPSYAVDQHTARGAMMKRAGQRVDDRFSGTDIGQQKTQYLFQRDGSLSPDKHIDDGFWPVWREFCELGGYSPEPRKPRPTDLVDPACEEDVLFDDDTAPTQDDQE